MDDSRGFNKCVVCGARASNRGVTCSHACASKLRTEELSRKILICVLCGEEFTNKVGRGKYCGNPHYKKCEVCQEDFPIKQGRENKKNPTCSPSCGAAYSHRSEGNKEKRKDNSLKKWGVEHPFQADEVKAKVEAGVAGTAGRFGTEASRQAMLRTLGVENVGQLRRREMQEANPMKTPEAKESFRKTMLERYGVESPLQVEEFRLKAQKSRALNPAPGGRVSQVNLSWQRELSGLTGRAWGLEQLVDTSAFDLGLPEAGIYLDIHPTITHNGHLSYACIIKKCTLPCQEHKPLPRSYHFDRAQVARKAGVRLLQFYDWDDRAAMQALIYEKLRKDVRKISARKCLLTPLRKNEANRFLKLHHIQGPARGVVEAFGLFQDEELLAVATFSRARFNAKADFEFLRYAVKGGVVLHGGAGKLFKAFIEKHPQASVVSYVDFNHSTGPSFLASLNFQEGKPTGPTTVWWSPMRKMKVPQTSLLMRGADRLLGTSYGSRAASGLDNESIMLLEGFLPVHTAGNRVFHWSPKECS